MRDEIFTFESYIAMGSLDDHKGFGALHHCTPSFGGLEPPLCQTLFYLYIATVQVLSSKAGFNM